MPLRYRVLLLAFPPDFRREYGAEIVRTIADRRADGRAVWAWAIADVIRSAPTLRMEEEMTRSTIGFAAAALVLAIASSTLVVGASSPGSMLVSVLVHLAAMAVLVLPPVAIGRRLSKGSEAVYGGRGHRGFTWWLVPATALAIMTVWLGARQLLSDPKVENVVAMAFFMALAAMTAGGMVLRSRGRNVGNVLIIVSVVPIGMFVWAVFPPILALMVIVSALVEIGSTGRRTTAAAAERAA